MFPVLYCLVAFTEYIVVQGTASQKNGSLYFAKEVKWLMKKRMFEILETKCPSVTPSIQYKSIAVIQYITSSQKQEKNSLIFLWKESAHQNNRKMTKFKLPAHREEVEEFFNFMDRDYDGNLSFEVFSSWFFSGSILVTLGYLVLGLSFF